MADRIKLTAPYILDVGQSLFDQDPFNRTVTPFANKHSLNESHLRRLMIYFAHNSGQASLPVLDPKDPDPYALKFYTDNSPKVQNLIPKPKVYLAAIGMIAEHLAEIPEYLTYLRSHQETNGCYTSDGSWIPELKTPRNKKSGEGVTVPTRMYAARSYAFWEYSRQLRSAGGEVARWNSSPAVMNEASAIAAIEGQGSRPLTPEERAVHPIRDREWVLKSASSLLV